MAPTSKLVAVLALAARLGGGTGADYEELAGAKSCDAPARAGDHVLSRYTTERPAGTFAFELPQFEWCVRHAVGRRGGRAQAGGRRAGEDGDEWRPRAWGTRGFGDAGRSPPRASCRGGARVIWT